MRRVEKAAILCENRNCLDVSLKQNLFNGKAEENFTAKRNGSVCNEQPIPEHQIPQLRRHEKPVVGSVVDSNIVPGFKYTVRVNGTTKMLFEGQSKYLENIGQGFEKKLLTFERDDILQNNNYIWSNSSLSGFAFSIKVLNESDEFSVYQNNEMIGKAIIETVSDEQEVIRSEDDRQNQRHVKDVQVNFTCRFKLTILEDEFSSDVAGVVTLTKYGYQTRASVKQVLSMLLPSGKLLLLKPE